MPSATKSAYLPKPLSHRTADVEHVPNKSSYGHSFYYETPVDHTLLHVRNREEIRTDSDPSISTMWNTFESTNKITFVPKYWENCSSRDFFQKSALFSRPQLKTLQEKCTAKPPRPLHCYSTTAGSSFTLPKKWTEPKTHSSASCAHEFAPKISSPDTGGLPSFSPNEPGHVKHLDSYLTTLQSTHYYFSEDQQKGLGKKDILTVYDAIGVPKARGFGLKKLEPFGSYFHRDAVAPYRVQHRPAARVPFSGNTTTYKDSYNFRPSKLTYQDEDIIFPLIYKRIDTSSYCTEQCHVGTGWPVRATVNIGTVTGTY